jgi:hypothetical protein
MEDLLENLRIGHEARSFGYGALQQALAVELVRVRRSHEVHGNVGVDEDQSPLPRYPRPISSNISSIVPAGNACSQAVRRAANFCSRE